MKHVDICILLAKAFFFAPPWMRIKPSNKTDLEENFLAIYNIFQASVHRAAFVVQYVCLQWMYQYFSFHFRKVLSKYLKIFLQKNPQNMGRV